MHTYLPLASLIVPDHRQRREFKPEAELELANSIREQGLLHAICVRKDGRTLVAGERRVRAIARHLVPLQRHFSYGGSVVPFGCVPVVEVSSDDPLELEEIELAENMQREDLTFQEEASTVARLMKARKERASRDGKIYTTADLAKELEPELEVERADSRGLGYHHGKIKAQLIIAQNLDNPLVSKAKNLKDAYKALKREDEAKRVAELGVVVGRTFSTADHTVVNEDCLLWMAMCEDKFDVILTDPPYGMGADDFGDGAGRLATIEHGYDDSYEAWQALMRNWCPKSFDIAKEQAHAYVFCDIDNFHELRDLMRSAGWYVFRTPFTVFKTDSGRVPLPDLGPRRQTEWILYAIKGKKPTTSLYSDVIKSTADDQLGFGAQKPVAVFLDLLRRSVRPGDAVLDTFGGTGTLLPAAHEMKVRATVIERAAVQYGLCLERLAGLSAQTELV